MGIADDAVEIRSQGWRTLAALHGALDTELERALQREHKLSVVEYTVLDALSRQDGWHMRMAQLARAAALSSSATTRLVNRLEDRGLLTRILCADDRRGIYTELTPAGRELLESARPTHDATLEAALDEASKTPELAPLVRAPPRASRRLESCRKQRTLFDARDHLSDKHTRVDDRPPTTRGDQNVDGAAVHLVFPRSPRCTGHGECVPRGCDVPTIRQARSPLEHREPRDRPANARPQPGAGRRRAESRLGWVPATAASALRTFRSKAQSCVPSTRASPDGS